MANTQYRSFIVWCWIETGGILRDLLLDEGIAAYQLVGEVTAHQGSDG